ncbi:MAG: LysR family transcriptional regulator [Anderseniella sp.]
MRFTFKHLEYFVAAAEVGSIKLASERINISQPSISSAISHLERELDLQLFVRHHAQGLALTSAGKRMMREARLLLRQGESLYDVANELQNELTGRLTVGCMITLAPVMAPELCKLFMQTHPRVHIDILEGSHEELLRSLSQVEIDIALSYDLAATDEMVFEPLAELGPQVLVSAKSPLARRDEISLKELADHPMVLLDLPYSAQYFLSLFEGVGLKPNVVAKSRNQDIIRTMVANDYGFTILNSRPKNLVAMDGRKLKVIKLAEHLRPTRIGFMTLASAAKPRLLTVFEDHCRKVITKDNIPGMSPAAQ